MLISEFALRVPGNDEVEVPWSSEPSPPRVAAPPAATKFRAEPSRERPVPPTTLPLNRKWTQPPPPQRVVRTTRPADLAPRRTYTVQCGAGLPVEVYASSWLDAFSKALSVMPDIAITDADLHIRSIDGDSAVAEERCRGLVFVIEAMPTKGETPSPDADITVPSPLALPSGVLPPEAEQTDETEQEDATTSAVFNPYADYPEVTLTVPTLGRQNRVRSVILAVVTAMLSGLIVGGGVALLGL